MNVLARHPSGPGSDAGECLVQYGALPYRRTAGGAIEYLLVTSRRTGRWILPKGSRMKGMSAPLSAAEEAFEEAGVRGAVESGPLGSYRTLKQRARIMDVTVYLFALRVERVYSDWPEKAERQRRWVSRADLATLLSDEGAVGLIDAFERDLGDRRQA